MRRQYGIGIATRRSGVVVREGVVKISPNEPCPCGSGVKYKKCCHSATGIRGWWRRRRAMQAKARSLKSG